MEIYNTMTEAQWDGLEWNRILLGNAENKCMPYIGDTFTEIATIFRLKDGRWLWTISRFLQDYDGIEPNRYYAKKTVDDLLLKHCCPYALLIESDTLGEVV